MSKAARKAKCPMCAKAAVEKFHPFCSKRCADLDLGRWLGGQYRVQTDEEPDFYELSEDDDNKILH